MLGTSGDIRRAARLFVSGAYSAMCPRELLAWTTRPPFSAAIRWRTPPVIVRRASTARLVASSISSRRVASSASCRSSSPITEGRGSRWARTSWRIAAAIRDRSASAASCSRRRDAASASVSRARVVARACEGRRQREVAEGEAGWVANSPSRRRSARVGDRPAGRPARCVPAVRPVLDGDRQPGPSLAGGPTSRSGRRPRRRDGRRRPARAGHVRAGSRDAFEQVRSDPRPRVNAARLS